MSVIISVTFALEVLVPEGLDSAFHKLLIPWDFHTEQCNNLEWCKTTKQKTKKHPINSDSAGRNSLMRRFGKVRVTQMTTCAIVMSRKTVAIWKCPCMSIHYPLHRLPILCVCLFINNSFSLTCTLWQMTHTCSIYITFRGNYLYLTYITYIRSWGQQLCSVWTHLVGWPFKQQSTDLHDLLSNSSLF